MEGIYLHFVIYFLILGICAGIDLTSDLRLLSEMLPGNYSNDARESRQFQHSFQRPINSRETPAEALTIIPLTAIYHPVNVTFLPECLNVYVEQTLYGKQGQHRQWLYSFSKDERSRSLLLKVYTFKDKSLVEKISKNPRAVKYLNENDVTTRNECDMHWRKLDESFVGVTSRRCIAVVDGQQVRISVTITLTQVSMQLDEGWYTVADGSKVIELDAPVFMTKKNTIAEVAYFEEMQTEIPESENDKTDKKPFLQKDARTRHMDNNEKSRSASGNELPQKQVIDSMSIKQYLNAPNYGANSDITYSLYNSVPDVIAPRTNKIFSNAIKKAGFDDDHYAHSPANLHIEKKTTLHDKFHPTWNIQTFDGVIDALVNGHKVYITVKMKQCFQVGTTKRERTIFGEYVDAFEIEKDFSEKQENKCIKFSWRRLQHTQRGFQDVIRQVIVHRNGTVHLTTVFVNEDKLIAAQAIAECSSYNQDTEHGDVRFYLDPYRNVVEVKRIGSLRQSLEKGQMIRMTMELDKCSGGNSEHIILGGELRSYEMGRNGNSVEVTIQSTQIVNTKTSGDLSVQEVYTILQMPKHGEVAVIRHKTQLTKHVQNVSIVVSGVQKYTCEMDPNSSTKALFLFIS